MKNVCFCYLKIVKGMPKLSHAITKHKLFEGNIGIDFEIIIVYRKNSRPLACVPFAAKGSRRQSLR